MNEVTQNIEQKLDEVIAHLREFKRQRLWNESSRMQSDDPSVQNRIEILRAWRRHKSLELDFAPYMIITNRTIMAIAMKNPQSLLDLERLEGIGPKKLEAYGEEILQLIATPPSTAPLELPQHIEYSPLS